MESKYFRVDAVEFKVVVKGSTFTESTHLAVRESRRFVSRSLVEQRGSKPTFAPIPT
jgi:hypothetical protein